MRERLTGICTSRRELKSDGLHRAGHTKGVTLYKFKLTMKGSTFTTELGECIHTLCTQTFATPSFSRSYDIIPPHKEVIYSLQNIYLR
jgi:hypothetical protein